MTGLLLLGVGDGLVVPAGPGDKLLLETGAYALLETGDYWLLE